MANISYLQHPLLGPDSDIDDSSCRLHPYHPFLYSSPNTNPNIHRNNNSNNNAARMLKEENGNHGSSDSEESVILNPLDLLDRENQATFVMDLLQDRVERSSPSVAPACSRALVPPYEDGSLFASGFGVDIEEDCEGDRHSAFDLALGFRELVDGRYNDEEEDGFFIQRREDDWSEAQSTASSVRPHSGVPVVGFGSDSEDAENGLEELVVNLGRDNYANEVDYNNGIYEDDVEEEEVDDVSVAIPLRWDSLRLEDNEDDFGWEEVDARVDEREVLSVFVGEGGEVEDDEEEEVSVSLSISPIIAPEDLVSVETVGGMVVGGGGVRGNVEWEVLLNAHSLDSGPDHDLDHHLEPYFGEHNNDYIYTAEYETLFGQFVESENMLIMGRPPAAKNVVENLLCVIVTKEDVEGGNALCAVCKDEISVGESAKQLPCAHRYHGECIVPWLGIRNTCPVCRHELPTDDQDYERRKLAAQRHT